MRGKAPKERGNVESEERDEMRGVESLDVGTGRLRGREPLGGTLRDSVGDSMPSLDVLETSLDEEDEEEEEDDEEQEESGLLFVLGAGQMFQSSVHLPLRGVVAEMGYQTHPQGVCTIPALDNAQVAGRLCQALPEAQAAVILSKSVSLKVACQIRQHDV
ncbi:hypothetical protein XENOCAPTIV_014434 [Xenoophorus captivus]|uniref:Uncharacterized protein n=1 Tax=Xenoophorus captivus TaxID=1517983 RepID=A0ABV0S7A8_9TELE